MSFDVRTRLSQLKSSAKARGIFINLDINKYQELIKLGCHFCGISLSKEKGYCLDRVDNSKGYIISNVVPCCKICNRAKSNMDVYEFIEWIQRAADHTERKITIAKELASFGFTQETYIKLEEELFKELNKNKEKHRMKIVPND